VFVFLSFLMVLLTSCCFDWYFLVNGICYLGCNWDVFNKPLVLWSVLLVADFCSKRYLQNQCPLVAKFGTRHANLLWGSALHV
jgi:hypothetical protein